MAAELLGKLIGLALAEGALPAGRLADLYGKCESAEYRRDFVAIALKYAKVRPRPCSRGPARGALLAGPCSRGSSQWRGQFSGRACPASSPVCKLWARSARLGRAQAERELARRAAALPTPATEHCCPALRGARPRPPRCSVV